MKNEVKQTIKQHQLEPHPEGGYFKETLIADEIIDLNNRESRPLYTSILFLLYKNEDSHFHRLQSDEIWIFQKGSPLDIVCINPDSSLEIIHLGLDEDCVPQAVVKAGTIFASYVPSETYSLVACVASPGFLYSEFELFRKEELLDKYPQYSTYIEKFAL